MGLYIASLFTLGLLATFLAAVLLGLMYAVGYLNVYLLFGITIFLNFLFWLIGPKISDWIYRFFYEFRWITIDELRQKSPETADFVEETCEKYGFSVPKLGIIEDKNPNALTYGSGRWNARLIVTAGLFEYLDDKELQAVYGHELGHIKNYDFIIMTIANTLVQLLYEAYIVTRHASRSGGRKKGKEVLVAVMVASYVFYWIGQYVLLYLSRLREYYADQFAAQETHPNYLSSALIKISYGILANPNDTRLIKSAKYMGIQDHRIAEQTGLTYYNCEKLGDFEPLKRSMLYDLKNPWAFISEIRSTHPLTGKRIKRLSSLTPDPMFDFNEILHTPIDTKRLYTNFATDVTILLLPTLLMLGFPVLYAAAVLYEYTPFSFALFGGGWLVAIGLGMMGRTLYRYPPGEAQPARVIDMMGDVYASPVRGKPVELHGELVGRGVPGMIFSEDMMMQDDTGIMYLNYQSWLPGIGNLLFGLKKIPKLVDQEAGIQGWFLRGQSAHIGLKRIYTHDESIRSFVRLGGLIGAALLILIGTGIMLYFNALPL